MDVIGIDEMPVLDLLMQVPSIPETNGVVFSTSQSWQGGGKVATAMVACARLGASVGLIGTVGRDAPGRFLMEDFQRHGIDTTQLRISGTTTLSIALAETETNGRAFVGARGDCEPLAFTQEQRSLIAQARYLHLSRMSPLTVAAARYAKEQGVTVVFDADRYADEIWERMELIDVLIASEYFMQKSSQGWEDVCDKLMARGPHTVVITLGEQGCVGKSKETPYFELPAFHGLPIVDTTGAGDVFHGAYIVALLDGADMQTCARFASAVAYLKCGYQGGRAGIPTKAMTMRFLKGEPFEDGELKERVRFYAHCPF